MTQWISQAPYCSQHKFQPLQVQKLRPRGRQVRLTQNHRDVSFSGNDFDQAVEIPVVWKPHLNEAVWISAATRKVEEHLVKPSRFWRCKICQRHGAVAGQMRKKDVHWHVFLVVYVIKCVYTFFFKAYPLVIRFCQSTISPRVTTSSQRLSDFLRGQKRGDGRNLTGIRHPHQPTRDAPLGCGLVVTSPDCSQGRPENTAAMWRTTCRSKSSMFLMVSNCGLHHMPLHVLLPTSMQKSCSGQAPAVHFPSRPLLDAGQERFRIFGMGKVSLGQKLPMHHKHRWEST